MIYRCIAPTWAVEADPTLKRVVEGEFTSERVQELNEQGYNIFYLPNSPSIYHGGKPVEGADIDNFNFCFVDMDLKDGKYANKQEFILYVQQFLIPTSIVDSGNGVHVYWKVRDLDAMSYLRLQRRLMRKFNTDEAVGQIFQLMRVPATVNTKHADAFVLCQELQHNEVEYTPEQLDLALPMLTRDDELYCQQHFNRTYGLNQEVIDIEDKLPMRFERLIRENKEVKDIWSGNVEDRSISDYRLAHIMFADGFSRDEALSVLISAAKALSRAPAHRQSYALNIVDKIWTFEMADDKGAISLDSSVRSILRKAGGAIKGTRFPCWKYLDDTERGFRLTHVIGLVAGSGVGKTAVALNMFMGFAQSNPGYEHLFVSLEQSKEEIADRWVELCAGNEALYDKVHILDNYDAEGKPRRLTLEDIKYHIMKFQAANETKIGCVVIDHIGALKMKGSKNGTNQDIMDICHEMKGFAIETNTLLIMQSQAPRAKAGDGDLELNKDAAYGSGAFEWYCDYLITMWQPLKQCYMEEGCPTVTAFKFCKIRHKKHGKDRIQEDVRYTVLFDPATGRLKEMNQQHETSFAFFLNKATNKRKADRKTDIVSYESRRVGETNAKPDNRSHAE